MYRGKKVVIGITGGIAAYRVLSLIRELKNEQMELYAVMTNSARRLIGEETVTILTEHPVFKDLFERIHIEGSKTDITHIALGQWADCFVVAPATNHIIAQLAIGAGDDPVTLTALASSCPRIVVPAANSTMYQQKTNRRNLETLRKDGWIIVEACEGNLACNEEGIGHIAEQTDIKEAIYGTFEKKILKDFYVVVTAGPTREHLDPVRFISNPSTGKMGFAIAKMAKRMGAAVSLVHGAAEFCGNIRSIAVTTTAQMKDAVHQEIKRAIDSGKKVLFISAAAPADYRSGFSDSKIKKGSSSITVELFPTEDILKSTMIFSNKIARIGFAAETDNLIDNARAKLIEKQLDFIVANDVSSEDSGFASDNNKVTILWKDGSADFGLMSKAAVARNLFELIREHL